MGQDFLYIKYHNEPMFLYRTVKHYNVSTHEEPNLEPAGVDVHPHLAEAPLPRTKIGVGI